MYLDDRGRPDAARMTYQVLGPALKFPRLPKGSLDVFVQDLSFSRTNLCGLKTGPGSHQVKDAALQASR
jgi:hypothetical protein